MKPIISLCTALLCSIGTLVATPARAQVTAPVSATLPTTFVNPLRTDFGADPWITHKDGFYFYTATSGNEVQIAKSRTLAGLATAPHVTIWRRPATGPNSREIWAPELHFLRGKWFVYYTATTEYSKDSNRRVFALEALTDDPQGRYIERGQMRVPGADAYAIDGTVYQRANGDLFFVYSGHETRESNRPGQHIFIAPMSAPLTISGSPVRISSPTLPWEIVGWKVNEGPEVLEKNGHVHVIYSASGGTTPAYALGMVSNPTGNLLDAAAWTKSQIPVYETYNGPDGSVYAPGHNGFFKSPDGTEDWIVYHAKEDTENSWERRLARAQKFTWGADHTPNFGFPVPALRPLAVPSGEPGSIPQKRGSGTGLRAEYFVYEGDKPNYDTPRGVENGQNVDFNTGLRSPSTKVGADRFAIRWRGQIEPRFSGMYAFQTYADDGVRVKVGGTTIINRYLAGNPTASRGFKYLQVGQRYDIEVEYFELAGSARCSLYWASDKQPMEPVPTDWLFAPANTSAPSAVSARSMAPLPKLTVAPIN